MLEGLTDEQLDVVVASVESRQLVTAGPGTGKTHTLVARIGHLVEELGLHPGGILTLSFSRAAIGELRGRLRATGDDAGRVAPVTFDSFATRLLVNVDPEGAWIEQSYDGRIQAAIDRMKQVGEFLQPIEHVCVDELQDLVGVRMRFVRALLEEMNVGFTLLGDPSQGIYDFSLGKGETAEDDGAPALYAWLRGRFADDLVNRPLTFNHRAKSELAKKAALIGSRVVGSPSSAARELTELLLDAPRLPSLGLLRNVPRHERTAVLCRNNGQALWVSRSLRNDNIDHVLQRGATNRSVAPWVARLVSVTGGGVINQARFERSLLSLNSDAPDPETAWSILRRVARVDSDIDIDRLVMRLREGSVPDELHVARSAPIVVSTVHRAKGLEFDRVVLLDCGWREPFDDEYARTLYVAMTRTIETLVTADLPDLAGRLESNRYTRRWVHTGWKYWQRRGMEVCPNDVDTLRPAEDNLLLEQAGAIQERLASEVRPGDPVTVEFIRPKIGSPAGAFYRVKSGDATIGMMSERFGADLVTVLKVHKKWDYPRRIEGLSVDAVRSVGGDGAITDQAGLGPGGAWLAPALVGMGKFEWS